jgi:hypothetical protein
MVDVPTKPVSAVGVTFDEPVNVQSLIEDGSIVDAVSLDRLLQGPIALGTDQFSYHADARTLEITFEEPLPEGAYQLRLDDELLADLAGNPLQGGRHGETWLEAPEMAVETLLMAAGVELQVDSYSVPSVVDWNNDGQRDLIVGEKTAAGEGKVRVYLNQGDADAPDYQAYFYAQAEGADLTVAARGCMGVAPRVFDWDEDGRKDIVLGLSDGTVQVALNLHTDEAPLFGSPTNVQVGPDGAKTDIDVGDRATIDVADWNNDGRYDLVLGNFDGEVLVLINQSDAGPADFVDWTIVTDDGGDMSVPSGRSSVAVGDLNGDGLDDLVIGNTMGQLLFCENSGSDDTPSFGQCRQVRTSDGFVELDGFPRSRPFVDDIDGDGAMDILVGAADGRVRLYAGLPPAETGVDSPTGSLDDSVTGGDEDYVYAFSVPAATSTAAWQCPQNRLDVNHDGRITPLDALLLINRIAVHGFGPLHETSPMSPPYWDCSGNGDISPLDILLVVRDINDKGPRSLDPAAEISACSVTATDASACTGEAEADGRRDRISSFLDCQSW